MGIGYYVARRAAFSIAVVFCVLILAFSLIKMAPGDPAQLAAGEGASPEYVEIVRHAYGLDKPVFDQLIIYLSRILQGDLGYSIMYGRPVLQVILERLPQTLLLAGTAITIALILGILIGITCAKKPYGLRDSLISAATLAFYSTPIFWMGFMLIFAFALWIPIFPTGGMLDIGAETTVVGTITSMGRHLILPSLTLASFLVATYARLTRAGLLEALGMNYILQARAKGVSEHNVLYKHALKNALLPIITVASLQVGLMIAGAILTESVFSWPGIGTLLVLAVYQRDFPLVTGIFVFVSSSVALSNLAADIAYGIVDPRIKTGTVS